MSHSRLFKKGGVFVLAALAVGTRLRADDVAATEEGPPVDVGNAVRFTVPAAVGGPARYRVTVQFAGETEQSVSLYVWAADTNDTGHWKRRLFYNSYWQGADVTGTLLLESGRTYALLAHRKDAPSPGFGLPWTQLKTVPDTSSAQATDAAPLVRAMFPQSGDLFTVATLQPVAPTAPVER